MLEPLKTLVHRSFTTRCPYCNHQNTDTVLAERTGGFRTILCDNEDGGCDEYYAVRFRVEVHTEIYTVTKFKGGQP